MVLADEPTGNLDSASGAAIVALLRELNQEGVTIAVITHNVEVARATRRRIEIRDGRITSDTGGRQSRPPAAGEVPPGSRAPGA
jgi:putative ABC transport system ATP-binding protein